MVIFSVLGPLGLASEGACPMRQKVHPAFQCMSLSWEWCPISVPSMGVATPYYCPALGRPSAAGAVFGRTFFREYDHIEMFWWIGISVLP